MTSSTDSVAAARSPSSWLPTLVQRIRALFARLPQGNTLPPEVWRTRHRFMLGVIWLQLAALTIASLVVHESASSMTFGLLPILACASAAALPTGSRRLRGSMVAFAALYCSAALVNLAHGAPRSHRRLNEDVRTWPRPVVRETVDARASARDRASFGARGRPTRWRRRSAGGAQK